MYNIIKSYCENNSDNGLFLIDMPTGFGKTYSVLEYIFEACQDRRNRGKKFFFITPLKKNLPVDELKKLFEKRGRLKEFEKKVMCIYSNMDTVMKNYNSELAESIPDDIKKTDEYEKFDYQLRDLKRYKKIDCGQMYEYLEKDFREKTEPAFRRMLQNILAKEFSSVEDRLSAIRTDKRWKWLGELYPTVFTNDYQIYFMSMDKFILKHSTIVEPPYLFADSKIIDNAVIFIDEFDSTKETMLKRITEDSLGDKIDFIEIFKEIYSSMKTDELPEIFITPSRKNSNKYKDKSLREIVDYAKKMAEEIYSKYLMQFNYRTDDTDNLHKNFLFHDYSYYSVTNESKKFICIDTDKTKKLNLIKFTDEKPQKHQNIYSFISEIKGFISWFQGMVNILAINYKQLKDERPESVKNEFTQEQAIRTILSEFRLNKEQTEYIVSQIMLNPYRKRNDEFAGFDLSVYENGFRYYCFENNAAHDMQSKIIMSSFNNTPEKMLLRFCEKAKVIGTSATATLPTVIGNFDLEYLKNKLGSRFYTISEKELSELKNKFAESQSGYKQIKIHAELFGASEYSLQTWCSIINNDELAEHIYNELERNVKDEKNNYNKERYARIAMAFKAFLENKDIRSFLCFLTRFPKENDVALDKNILAEIFKYISSDLKNDKYAVEYLEGKNYDETKNNIIKRLADGEKLFVISTYQTIGAGQNLQYPIPENLKGSLIHSNTFQPKNEKDFDAVYLENPTNIIVNMSDDWTETDFAKYMFHMEFLHTHYELSEYDTRNNIKEAFKCYSSGKKPGNHSNVHNVYNCDSVKLCAARFIIQAIGRICRTNQKSENIYIFADSRIAEKINPDIIKKGIFNFEFIALCDKIKELHQSRFVSDNLIIQAETISNRAGGRYIDNMRLHWTDRKMNEWKKLRDVVLRFPTMSSNEEENLNVIRCNFFVQLPKPDNKLYYLQENNFHEINISFESKDKYILQNEVKTRLSLFMKWDILKEYFRKKGYATEFKPNKYIMSPAVWNNIYKGALGEAVGQFWFSRILEIDLEELNNTDIFELFDFKIPDKPVFVDFKNWSENYDMELQETLDKISSKAEKCKCKLAIIANILTSSKKYVIRTYALNGINILVIPSLLLYENDKIIINAEALEKIRSCLNEYTD